MMASPLIASDGPVPPPGDEADAASVPLRFQLGARPLLTVSRRLVRMPLALDAAVDGIVPALPRLPESADGFALFSLRADRIAAMRKAAGSMIAFERQRYTRHFVDLTMGYDAYLGTLSANSRAAIKRKSKRLAAECGGQIDIRCYRTPSELETFHAVAHALSERTYQARLFAGGLPGDAHFVSGMLARGAAGAAIGWLLWIGDGPAAYLYCRIDRGIVRYDFVGHDPQHAKSSPGFVLQSEVIRTLQADPAARRFDFTEGEGQHKRQFATGGVACVDLLLLRPRVANRALTLALGGFDGAARMGKRAAERAGLHRLVRRALR